MLSYRKARQMTKLFNALNFLHRFQTFYLNMTENIYKYHSFHWTIWNSLSASWSVMDGICDWQHNLTYFLWKCILENPAKIACRNKKNKRENSFLKQWKIAWTSRIIICISKRAEQTNNVRSILANTKKKFLCCNPANSKIAHAWLHRCMLC